MISWMIGSAPLRALIGFDPHLAAAFFDTPSSFTFGSAPPGWATTPVNNYKSYTDYAAAYPSQLYGWVVYNPENWAYTPLIEQQHPKTFMVAFTTLAHIRCQKVILAPARNLLIVSGGDCNAQSSEPQDAAYLRCGFPTAGAVADVFECQAQAHQATPQTYQSLVQGTAAQLPDGHPLWAGLTTMRGDPVSAMVACYKSVLFTVHGFWLNTTPGTIQVAAEFLTAISSKEEM